MFIKKKNMNKRFELMKYKSYCEYHEYIIFIIFDLIDEWVENCFSFSFNI